jgi:hypothetical protein
LGRDAVFMDVAAIPFAVDYIDFISEAIRSSKVLVALIGARWLERIRESDDPVRRELETAIEAHVPILPVLIGNTPMPDADDLPPSLVSLASLNATTVGVLHDFDSHMRLLTPQIESLLGSMGGVASITAETRIIRRACRAVIDFLASEYATTAGQWHGGRDWKVYGTTDFDTGHQHVVSLFLHRVVPLGNLLELHVILSFWSNDAEDDLELAGWVLHRLEQTPVIPAGFLTLDVTAPAVQLKIRSSDEDARQIWKMITDRPLRLSLAYVATVSPKAGTRH